MCKKVIVLAMLLVSIGWLSSAALAQPPVRTGLVFWLDASNTGSLTLAGGKVARWNDLSGAGNYADQTAAAQQPTYLASGLNGKGIVDFGDSVYGNPLTTYQPWMQFRNASGAALNISNVRTVFWVCGMDAGSNGFLLGDDNNYHFHRGQQNQLWEAPNGWTSANIRNGSTYLNGVKIDGSNTVLPTAYSMISLVTTANVETSMLTRDRTYRSGGIKLGELLIYSTALTDAERISVEGLSPHEVVLPRQRLRAGAAECRDGSAARGGAELDGGPVRQDPRCVPGHGLRRRERRQPGQPQADAGQPGPGGRHVRCRPARVRPDLLLAGR